MWIHGLCNLHPLSPQDPATFLGLLYFFLHPEPSYSQELPTSPHPSMASPKQDPKGQWESYQTGSGMQGMQGAITSCPVTSRMLASLPCWICRYTWSNTSSSLQQFCSNVIWSATWKEEAHRGVGGGWPDPSSPLPLSVQWLNPGWVTRPGPAARSLCAQMCSRDLTKNSKRRAGEIACR